VTSPAFRGKTVLLAEDDEIVRAVVARALEREGFLVLPAANAEEALAIWREGANITALITDVRMGDGPTGLELTERLLREAPALPVLIVSAYLSRDPIAPGPNVAFLHKPFLTSQLIARLRELLLRTGENRDPMTPSPGC